MSGNTMLSRARVREMTQTEFNLDAHPQQLQSQVLPLVLEQLSRPNWTIAELLRLLFLHPDLAALRDPLEACTDIKQATRGC